MKKIMLLLLACTLVFSDTQAQSKKNNSLLWEISGKGLRSPSYLFGTYHLAGKSLVDSLPEIKTRFNTCTAVVGEVVVDSIAGAKMMSYMMAPDSATLDKIFTPDEYQQVYSFIKQFTDADAESKAFDHFKPAAVAVIVAVIIAPKTISPTNPPLDSYFQEEGKRHNDKIIGLETIQQQTDMLFNSPIADQKKQLLAYVKKKDQLKADAVKGYKTYLRQDLDEIARSFDENDDLTPEQTEKLLKERNLTWMKKLPGIMHLQPTFIAVGAGHLVGQYGLIDQLRSKGYTVKAIKI
jgi:uncharacterized protein YbaP (TraB family)